MAGGRLGKSLIGCLARASFTHARPLARILEKSATRVSHRYARTTPTSRLYTPMTYAKKIPVSHAVVSHGNGINRLLAWRLVGVTSK
jgi:hypothetical protein